MYKMLFISIQGEWIPVLENIAKDNLATHVVVHSRYMRDMTEKEWIAIYAEQNKVDPARLRFFSYDFV